MLSSNCSKVCQHLVPNIVFRRASNSRNLHESYYEILGVSRTCNAKEIKHAYIRLSKIYHPDKCTAKASQSRFVQILEAYNVLNKPHSRRQYDLQLEQVAKPMRHRKEFYEYQSAESERSKGYGYGDPNFWSNRAKANYGEKSYYEAQRTPRLPNGVVVFYCIILLGAGTIIQLLAIRHSLTFDRDELLKRSNENQQILDELQERAQRNGTDLQLKLLEQRLYRSRSQQD